MPTVFERPRVTEYKKWGLHAQGRNNPWQCRVRIMGHPQHFASFKTPLECWAWGNNLEEEIRNGVCSICPPLPIIGPRYLRFSSINPLRGGVYVVMTNNRMKIGKTSKLYSRMSALQTANPDRLMIYRFFIIDSDRGRDCLESWLHNKLRKHKATGGGEWFFITEETLSILHSSADECRKTLDIPFWVEGCESDMNLSEVADWQERFDEYTECYMSSDAEEDFREKRIIALSKSALSMGLTQGVRQG